MCSGLGEVCGPERAGSLRWLTPPGGISERRAFRKWRTGPTLRQWPRFVAILSVSLRTLVRLGPATKRAPNGRVPLCFAHDFAFGG